MSSNGYGGGASRNGTTSGPYRPAYQTSLLPPQPSYPSSLPSSSFSSRRDQYGGTSDYLPATSVATGYTVPSSAASIAGYRTHTTTSNDYQPHTSTTSASISTSTSTSNLHHAYARPTLATPLSKSERPYVPRQSRPQAARVDNGATGLAALVSATEATETYERREAGGSSLGSSSRMAASSTVPVPRAYHTLQSSSSSTGEGSRSTQQNSYASQPTRHPSVTSTRVTAATTTISTADTSTDDSSYPVAPSPAYDPVAFERIIGLSSDEPSTSTQPTESEQLRAQRLGISPAMLMNRESRLQALVKATEPGQLEAWQTKKRKVVVLADTNEVQVEQDQATENDSGALDAPTPSSVASSSQGRGRGGARVRKPRPKKGEPGWKPRASRRAGGNAGTDTDAATGAATQEPAVVEESSPGPFNSLIAHLAAYSQRDKALHREEAGYGRIPDINPEELLIRRQREAAQRLAEEEARRKAMLPAENNGGGMMDIDLSGFGDIDAEIDEQADYEAQRQARIAHNNRIMAALGLGPVEEPEPTPEPRPRGRPLTHKPRRKREPRYSPDGTTADPCVSGRQRLAYVEIPQIFRSRRVQTLFRYSEIPPVPENPVESESEVEEVTQDIEVPVPRGPKLHYSQLVGDHCHQCRRKSTKPKMSCRNKACGLKYCVTCVQRYNFSFEEYSRTFICPRCQGYCNCSACLRSSGLLKLLKLDENQDKLRMSLHAAKSAPNVQVYLEMMGAPKAPPMPLQELHKIRFINKEEDIITPEIPDDILSELMSRRIITKKTPKKVKKSKKKQSEINDDGVDGNVSEVDVYDHDHDHNHDDGHPPAEVAPQQEPESSHLSDEEDVAYYDPQYGYQAASSRRPADANYQYAIANAWSVYQT